jgi:hypothetical protein
MDLNCFFCPGFRAITLSNANILIKLTGPSPSQAQYLGTCRSRSSSTRVALPS